MMRWMGECAGFGGAPASDRGDIVASCGGDTFVEVDLHVGRDPDDEEDEECPGR